MKTQVSELADNRVRLEIEVPAHDVDHAFEHALNDLSASVRIPGFRKGKAPAGMVARQIGREALVEEALRDHLTGWYSRAVAEIGIDPVDRPTIDWSDEPVEGSPFSFTAEVDVKPPPKVTKYKGLEGVRQPIEVPDEAVDAEIDRLRLSVAELRPVERPAAEGDFVVIDYEGMIDGKPFDESSGTDYGVQLGDGRLVDDLERGIIGMSAGDERTIEMTVPSESGQTQTATFLVQLNDVKERVLPELDDDLATSVSEFDTLAELRKDITDRVRELVTQQSDSMFRGSVLDALAAELSTPPPDSIVQTRARQMVRGLVNDLQQRGLDLENYLRVTGQDGEQLLGMITAQADDAVRKDLALEAVADAEAIEVSDELVEEWIREQSSEGEESPDEAVERLTADAAVLTALRTDLRMQKALDIVVSEATEISPEKASARDKLWTPEKDSPAASEKPTEIWTPGSAQPADR
jgi:trigger factor